jgi:hypothetical protein
MTLCPIAIAVGCRKCPIFAACPLKTVIGDQPKAAEAPAAEKGKPAAEKGKPPSRKKKSR